MDLVQRNFCFISTAAFTCTTLVCQVYHTFTCIFHSGNKPGSPGVTAPAAPQAPARSAKRKVIETEPEPAYTEIAESARSIDLLVSVNCDYCKYKCKTDTIHFKDTLMFQTRVFECVAIFHIDNKLFHYLPI